MGTQIGLTPRAVLRPPLALVFLGLSSATCVLQAQAHLCVDFLWAVPQGVREMSLNEGPFAA